MVHTHRDWLRSIKTFPSLIKYLRDELDWPIEASDFDELTYDYDPEELGIDRHNAAKIEQIKQLRPLVSNQPWGIFFIKFEPKRLPVVALRRILSSLVLRKRVSARKSEQAAWKLNDLLFISNYGEGDDRQMTFAHFAQAEDEASLPTLKVLGWDDADTAFHLDHVHSELKQKLRWPSDDTNLNQWREHWSAAFVLRHREVITTSKELAVRLADLARKIRKRGRIVLRIETDRGPLRKLLKAFQESLIHDLNEDDFADMYAQTITYGLFSAACSRTVPNAGTAVIADNLADMVPVTNPFLKEMLATFLTIGGRRGKIDFDELGIQEVVDLLNSPDTHMEAILRDFGNRTRQEDPVIHFYELFLNEYDKKKKVQRGVFYTPQSVVSYIVRSVHELLQTEFGLDDGLASTTTWNEFVRSQKKRNTDSEVKIPDGLSGDEPFVQILDPATGTATFLVEVIDLIYKTMRTKWLRSGLSESKILELWNDYVPEHLLPRLYGFELMMAPYAIAHMKVGLKLGETGYRFGKPQRVRIYLTNSLEPPHDIPGQLILDAPALAHEAQAVNRVKSNQRFTVLIGNPPYAGYSANNGPWIENLMKHYKTSVAKEERQIQRLSNDYVKFVRLAEHILSVSDIGILGFITDSGYFSGILFRDMRAALRRMFQSACLYNLHGGGLRGPERHQENDENVFEITQGVALSILLKNNVSQSGFRYAEILGKRSEKYRVLSETNMANTTWITFNPSPPQWFFLPVTTDEIYDTWLQLTQILGTGRQKEDRDRYYGTGVKTRHDDFVVGWTPIDAVTRVKRLANRKEKDSVLIDELGLCTTAHFSIKNARKRAEARDLLNYVRPIAYRPFDWRYVVYLREFVCEPKMETMRHMLHSKNIAMALLRRNRKENSSGYFLARGLVAKDLVSNLDDALVWPLYILPEGGLQENIPQNIGTPNISEGAIERFTTLLSLKWMRSKDTFSIFPEDIFHYIYAILHSQTYRLRYAEFINKDFPRIPIPADANLFWSLVNSGHEIALIHLLESPKLKGNQPVFFGTENSEVQKVSWSNNIVAIDNNFNVGFKGVPEYVFNFHIGAYQVCEKWLKDRKGRTLSKDEITRYKQIVVAISETIRIMKEIDEVIAQHGGWPNAFLATTGK